MFYNLNNWLKYEHLIERLIKVSTCYPRGKMMISNSQGGRGHLAVYYTSPQSLKITFPCSLLINLGDCYCFLLDNLIVLSYVSTTYCNLYKG